ncbi:CstA-like transporter-associated (seleno)protein [Streptomyces sp. CA-132043]|uniref:CstA-like transporter-associated (seleno)protein n=1 Tax=Streptomyces sp. CA-132043 TaxID=3240048 RepID=UPI003D937A1D
MSVPLLRALHRVRWYVREFTGEHAYGRYVAHARAQDPPAPVLSRAAFERYRTDRRDEDPLTGHHCC